MGSNSPPGIELGPPALGVRVLATGLPGKFAEVFRLANAFKGGCHLTSGEGNGTPLQYSCLENPMDGGAW